MLNCAGMPHGTMIQKLGETRPEIESREHIRASFFGSSLFQVDKDETRKKNLELRKKRWNKTVVLNLNAELRE